jgi:hypothetical protein
MAGKRHVLLSDGNGVVDGKDFSIWAQSWLQGM